MREIIKENNIPIDFNLFPCQRYFAKLYFKYNTNPTKDPSYKPLKTPIKLLFISKIFRQSNN